MRLRDTHRVWCAAIVLASLAGAQPRTVTLQNLSSHPRTQWFAAVVPFAPGESGERPEWHVAGHPTVWQPFGARWPDGSLRQALCMFRATLPAQGRAELELSAGAGPALAPAPWPALDLDVMLTVHTSGGVHDCRPGAATVLEENAARRVTLLRGRAGRSGIVCELIVTQWADQPLIDADLGLWFSDPASKAMQVHIERAAVRCRGHALLLRHPERLAMDTTFEEDGSTTVLLADVVVGDGQGIRRSGVLAPPLAGDGGAADQTILANARTPPLAATRWAESGAFGPFGHVPELPPWLRDPGRLRAVLRARHRRFSAGARRRGDPFAAAELGLAKNANQTGDQEDFGVVKLTPVARTGDPTFLFEVEASVLQEACRPVHFFESDATPVRPAAHPQWVVWAGRTHWHCKVSPDRLGKPCPAPEFESHGWTGKDRQHWSSLNLAAYALLTGAHWARREIENEIRLYLAGQTIAPALSTSGSGAPRGAGRTLLTASWHYLCTGDPALLERMHARTDTVHAKQWVGGKMPHAAVRPFTVHEPDGRMIGGSGPFWTPWQETLAAIGFAAFARVSDNRNAQQLADALATNTLRHGWRLAKDRPPMIAAAIRWNDDGAAPDPDALAASDAGTVQWADGTGFSIWGIGAVELARQAASRAGDTALEQRATAILRALRQQRRAPRDGWFDRFADWDAVR